MPPENQEMEWFDQFQKLILKNLSDNSLTNTWLAAQLPISVRTLYRIVKKQTGLSPNLYIRAIRLEEAYTLLTSKRYATVKEVVAKVGFRKNDYFTQLFKATYGENPITILKKD